MGLNQLRHRHWLVIGLAAGLLLGAIRAYFVADAEPEGPYESVSPAMFEAMLMQQDTQTNQYPYLLNLRIQPYHGRQVASAWYNRHFGVESGVNGVLPERYQMVKIVLSPPTAVYAAASPRLASLTGKEIEVKLTLSPTAAQENINLDKILAEKGFCASGGGATNVRVGKILPNRVIELIRLRGVKAIEPIDRADTVVGFLKRVQAKYPQLNLTFEYAWWMEPRIQLAMCTGIGVVGIGGIWPFVVYLIAFGKLKPPPIEKPTIDLSKVKSGSGDTATAPQLDMAAVNAHVQRLEEGLGTGSSGGAASATQQKPEAEVRKLETHELEALATEEQKPKHYAGQFYPTVAHAPKEEK